MDLERNLEAAREFATAAQLNPQDYESVFNAGVAFRLVGDNAKAEAFYRQAVQLKPKVRRQKPLSEYFMNMITTGLNYLFMCVFFRTLLPT